MPKRLLLPLLLTLALVLAGGPARAGDPLSPPQRQWLKNHGPLKVGVFTGYPPFGFLDAKGQPAGISIDLWKLLAQKLRLQVEFVPAQFADLLGGIKSGRLDSLAGVFPLPERRAYADFSQPWLDIGTYIWTSPARAKRIKGLADLQGLRVGAVRDDSGQVLAQAAGLEVTPFPDYAPAVEALAAGQVEAIVMDELVAAHLIAQRKLQGKLARAGAAVDQGQMTLPVARGNAVLLQILNQGLKAIKAPEMKKIKARWLS